MDTLRGVIERITYHNEENGYTVAKLTPEQIEMVGLTSFSKHNVVELVPGCAFSVLLTWFCFCGMQLSNMQL